MRPLICILLVLTAAVPAAGRTWYVTPDGTGDASTIQAAIDSAAAADTVLLADGTYTGDGNRDISFLGKAVTLRSESGQPENCVIDCQASAIDQHRAFEILLGEGPESRIEGIKMTNGNCSHGGAIRIHYSSPTITDCVLCGNKAGTGGAVHIYDDSYPTFENCAFLSNTATTGGAINAEWGGHPVLRLCTLGNNVGTIGGAINGYGVGLRLETCVLADNSGYEGGAICMDLGGSGTLFTGCTFARNSGTFGGAIYNDRTSGTFETCTFALNSGGHGAHVYTSGGEPSISNCILAYSTSGSAVYVNFSDPVPAFLCCDIFGNAGGDWTGAIADQFGINGNFSVCPSFCGAYSGEYLLCDQSPCLPGNHPGGYDCGLIGAHPEGCMCGPTEAGPTTWGGIKSLYR
jgi:hypothetical protein